MNNASRFNYSKLMHITLSTMKRLTRIQLEVKFLRLISCSTIITAGNISPIMDKGSQVASMTWKVSRVRSSKLLQAPTSTVLLRFETRQDP
jgi:hypothetical protein